MWADIDIIDVFNVRFLDPPKAQELRFMLRWWVLSVQVTTPWLVWLLLAQLQLTKHLINNA